MGPDLIARVRWNNVGVVALAAALLTLVVAWPALSPPAPSLPNDPPARVHRPPPPPVAETPEAETVPPLAHRPRKHRVKERRVRRPRRHRRPAVVVTPPVRAAAPPAYVAPAPAPEFAFER
jgi:hypothetical protein